jgi:hypothetical protein
VLGRLAVKSKEARLVGGNADPTRKDCPMRRYTLALITVVGIGVSACGASDGGTGYGLTMAGTPTPTTSGGSATLTVKNFLNWCSVEINGGSASTDATVTASVAAGTIATIVATPASSSFQIGPAPWFGVDQNGGAAAAGTDVGSGVSESSTATVAMAQTGTPRCVSVCCQEPGNGPIPCPTTNPCP